MLTHNLIIAILTISVMSAITVHIFENEVWRLRAKNNAVKAVLCIVVWIICDTISINLIEKQWVNLNWFLRIIEYSIIPLIPIYVAKIPQNIKISKPIMWLLGINVFLQICSVWNEWIWKVGENGIERGEHYWVLAILYLLTMLYSGMHLVRYNKLVQGEYWKTLIVIVVALLIGIMAKLYDNNFPYDWMAVAMVFSIMLIYYSSVRLKVDEATTLLNKAAHTIAIKVLNYDTVIIIIDVNDFKKINDNYGHQAGDITISLIAQILREHYSPHGFVYRMGGDEFCIILKQGEVEKLASNTQNYNIYTAISRLNAQLQEKINKKRKEVGILPNVAVGFAVYKKGESVHKAIDKADKMMYAKKKNMK